MSDPYEDEQVGQILREQSGGVTGVMWAALAVSAAIALAIVLLIDPREPASSVQNTMASRGAPAETTGVGSSEPNEAVERRWPAAMDDIPQ